MRKIVKHLVEKKPDQVQPFKDSAKIAMKKVLSHCHELFSTFTFTLKPLWFIGI